VLIVVAVRTWFFIVRMRGIGLVNERLAQMNELERAARKYQQIAELLPHVVWTATADGLVDFSNQRWLEYVGVGGALSWIDSVHPDDRLVARVEWEKAIAARRPMSIEARLAGSAGYRAFTVKATPIVQGEAVKWLGACADIEDQKVVAAQKEIQARQKSFFLNALSHDLRAPLHNVLLNAHLLKLSAQDENDAQSVSMIMENAVAAGDLVTRLLEFAKVGAHDENIVEEFSLGGMIHQIVRRFMPPAEQKGLALTASTGGTFDDVVIRSDRQKVERIISNLVDNGIKYTQRGGITIELKERGDEVLIRVADTGIGILPKNVPYLFDEFYQVNNFERDRSKGFGMGLAICRSLARHIGGDIRLAHTSGEGSCFEVTLKNIGADRRGRSGGENCDHASAEEAGLCGV
jgi:signal transduction histidine kinase